MTTVGENIKKIRKKKGLTQEQLGKLSGIATKQIGFYEQGRLNPKLETLKKIGDALCVPVAYLLKDTRYF